MQSLYHHVRTLLFIFSLLLYSVTALPKVLIFSKISPGAYRHDSIPISHDIITRLGNGSLALDSSIADPSLANSQAKWTTVVSDDDSLWTSGNYLYQYDAIIVVSPNDVGPPNVNANVTSVFSNASADALARYIQAGGNFVGIHCAACAAYTHPFYGRLVGAYFHYHPAIQQVGLRALRTDHPSTTRFPTPLSLTEEVYHFNSDPRAIVPSGNILVSNATAFSDPETATIAQLDGPSPRPLAWYRQGSLLDQPATAVGGGLDDVAGGPSYSGGAGRSFYTSLGHAIETWMTPGYQGHVLGGISWALASSTTKTNNASALIGQAPSSTSTNGSTSGGSTTSTANAAWHAGSRNKIGHHLWFLF